MDKQTSDAAVVAGRLPPVLDKEDPLAMPTKRVKELQEERALGLALMGGTRTMREAGTTYMPKHPAESDGSYAHRLASTHLYNGFGKTVMAQSGKLLGKPIVFGETVPKKAQDLAIDIDGQGRALGPFALDVICDAFVCGVSYIWVDKAKAVVGSTLLDEIKAGTRPVWIHVKASQVLGWRDVSVGGKKILTQVRFTEDTVIEDGSFGEHAVKRIRVLERGYFHLYELRESAEKRQQWILIDAGPIGQQDITMVPVYTYRTGFFEGEPALRSVAELNLEHWQSSSEQRVALSFLRFAMLVIAGVDTDAAIEVGPSKIIKLPIGGEAGYVEHSGSGIEAGAKDLEAIERRMRSAGMDIRIENAGKVTATASALDSEDSNAGLRAVAEGLGDSLAAAVQYTVNYMGASVDGGTIEVNTEFAEPVNEGDVDTLNTARAARDLSKVTYWSELKRRHVLSEDFDAEKEQALLADEPPDVMPEGAGNLQRDASGKPVPQKKPEGATP